MKGSSLGSRPGSLVCPLCEVHELYARDQSSARCGSCGGFVSGAMLVELRQITALPDAIGSHACECGHPEMRLLPDGTYHCPACGSEVVPIDARAMLAEPDELFDSYRVHRTTSSEASRAGSSPGARASKVEP
jgi:uncharacterized Zn finger protein (UPF0148 family)